MREGDVLELGLSHTSFTGHSHAQLAPGGDGPATLALEVSGGFAGERVDVRLLQLNRKQTLGRARVLNVLEPRPGRRTPECEQHPERGGRCDGCAFMSLELAAQRALKREMLAEVGLEVAEVEGDPGQWGYRHSAKRVAFGKAGRLWLGSYQRATHKGARMQGCRVDHPRLSWAADLLEEAARQSGIDAYDERSGAGDLRYVWLRTDGERVLLTLVTASEQSAAATRLPPLLPEDIDVAWSVQGARGNAMRGERAQVLRGTGTLRLEMAGRPLELGPLGFLQPNPGVAARCYQALVGEATGALAIDLYAGAGVTTGMLRERYREVVVSELHSESAQALGVAPERAEDTLERLVGQGVDPDLVVANPPRAGLRAQAVEQLRALAADRLRIMSCGPEALARDLAGLQEGGLYRLVGLRAFDTLPQTPHVELVASLERG